MTDTSQDATRPRDTVRAVPFPNGTYALIGYDADGDPTYTVIVSRNRATRELARQVLRWVRRDYRRRQIANGDPDPSGDDLTPPPLELV